MGLQAPVHPARQGGAVLASSAATQYPLGRAIPYRATRLYQVDAPAAGLGQRLGQPVRRCLVRQRGQQAQQQPCPGPGTR